MRMLSFQINRFPQLTSFVREKLYDSVSRNMNVWKAFLKYSQLDDETAKLALTSNQARPLLLISDLSHHGRSVFGAFSIYQPNRIYISTLVANKFEKEFNIRDADNFLEALILHELVHWGDFRQGGINPCEPGREGEMGEKFEEKAYGKVLKFLPWFES